MSYEWFLMLFKKIIYPLIFAIKNKQYLSCSAKKAWISIDLRLHSFIKEGKGDCTETSAMNHSSNSELCHPAAHIS